METFKISVTDENGIEVYRDVFFIVKDRSEIRGDLIGPSNSGLFTHKELKAARYDANLQNRILNTIYNVCDLK